MSKTRFLLDLSMRRGSPARQSFGSLLVANRKDHPVSFKGEIIGTIAGLWRNDDQFCAALLLDAHDGWAALAARKPSLAFEIMIRQAPDALSPVRVLTDKAVVPLLALDQAISRRWDGTAYRLDSLLAFAGRWFAGPGADLPRKSENAPAIGL